MHQFLHDDRIRLHLQGMRRGAKAAGGAAREFIP
jgi:hypothetical protein